MGWALVPWRLTTIKDRERSSNLARSEGRVERAFVKWCRAVLKLDARKMVVKGEQGWPDRTIVTPNGRIICIEFKAPSKESNTSSLQDDRIKELRG